MHNFLRSGALVALALVAPIAAFAQTLPVATTTLDTFLDTTFTLGFESILYVLGVIWPYLVVVGILWIFWRVGRSFFRR